MPDLSVSQRQYVQATYETAQSRIEGLQRANDDRRESDQRLGFIDELVGHQLQIIDLGFLARADFTTAEQDAILKAADDIQQLVADINDINDLTLTSVETDLASAILDISLDAFLWILKSSWIVARRYNRLPHDIPDDVRDAFCLYLFTSIQGQYNLFADRARAIAQEGCLNTDDYPETWLTSTKVNTAFATSKLAIDDHVALQRLKAAEREAERQRKEESFGVGGAIWAVVGWDSPWDFIADVGLTVAFGGVGAVRWAIRIKKAKDRVTRAKKLTQNTKWISKQIQAAEKRVETVRDGADKLRKTKALADIPAEIKAAFMRLKKREDQLQVLKDFQREMPRGYLRDAMAGAAANALADPKRIGGQAAEDVARGAIINFIAGTSLGQNIERRRDIILYKVLLSGKLSPTGRRMLAEYILLVWMQYAVVRMGVARLVHQQPVTVDHLIEAAGDAAEKILTDLKLIPDRWVVVAREGVRAFMKELAVEYLKKLVDEVRK